MAIGVSVSVALAIWRLGIGGRRSVALAIWQLGIGGRRSVALAIWRLGIGLILGFFVFANEKLKTQSKTQKTKKWRYQI